MKKRVFSFALAILIIVSSMATQFSFASSAASKTGIGMAEWALRAYNEKWKYVYGGASVGKVDCSGLVASYAGGSHGSNSMLSNNASSKGSTSSIPRVHGLILYAAATSSSNVAHMGVYVGKDENGNDMAVDARSSSIGVVYKTVASRTRKPWTKWFKHSKLSYPTTGWYKYNGKKYYYENGQFVVGKHTVDGVTYDFGKSGALKGEVASDNSKKTTTTPKAGTENSDVLKYGSKGDAVKKLQERLIKLGYLSGSADGSYGNKTVEAVKNFQKQVGITADGIAGKTTQNKLYDSSAPKATTTTTTTKKTTTTTTAKKTTTTTTKKKTTTTTAKKTTTTTADKKTTTTTTTTAKKTTAATSAVNGNKKYQELKKGDKGDPVCQLQYRLTDLGYLNVSYDGTYGEVTEKAVKAFQKKAGLGENGVASVETQQALFATNAPKASDPDRKKDEKIDKNGFQILRIGDSGDAVVMLQERLTELGYFDQEATGYFGTFTFDAIVDFQVNQNLLADGIVGEETFNKIYNDETVKVPEGYLRQSLITDDKDEEETESYLGKTITIDFNGETYIINEAINSLIENSVFL